MALSYHTQNHSPESKIREMISEALAKHPYSKEIYEAVFAFILGNMQNSFRLSGRIPDEQLEIFRGYADVFFNHCDKDIDYYFAVLENFDKYENVTDAIDYFLHKIMENWKEEPSVWENLVKRQDAGNKQNTRVKITL